jgi:hypothetical protein
MLSFGLGGKNANKYLTFIKYFLKTGIMSFEPFRWVLCC